MARKKTTTPRAAAPAAAAVADNRHLVYVHGICAHAPGYSNPWWAALKPYVQNLIPDANRHEVLWSQAITAAAAPARAVVPAAALAERLRQAQLPQDTPAATLAAEIRDLLTDRVVRQHMLAAAAGALAPATAPAAAATPFLTAESVAPLGFLNVPFLECIGDFMSYLLDPAVRARVLARFDEVVKPLLQQGARLEIIAHSWGTVVAYEALRRMDAGPTAELPDASVLTLFTPGSALSIPAVKSRLMPGASDGRKPRVVQTWVNLDALFDVVGGPLKGNPFEVDFEYLNLPPVGCSVIIPNPVCSHGSYFLAANLTVNRDIFGKYIELPIAGGFSQGDRGLTG